MPHAYTEDPLVEQPAIGLFSELVTKLNYLRRKVRASSRRLLPLICNR